MPGEDNLLTVAYPVDQSWFYKNLENILFRRNVRLIFLVGLKREVRLLAAYRILGLFARIHFWVIKVPD